MNRIKLVALIACLLCVSEVFSQFVDKDILVRKLFTALQLKDQQEFIQLYTGQWHDNNTRSVVIAKINTGNTAEKAADEFNKTIQQGEMKGVDWPMANLISYTADSILDKNTGLYELKGKIYFNSNEKEFFIAFEKTMWQEDQGWTGISIREVNEKSEERSLGDDGFQWEGSPVMPRDTIPAMLDTLQKKASVKKTGARIPAKKPTNKVTPPVKTPARKDR